MNEEILVKVGADVSNLGKGLKKAADDMQKFSQRNTEGLNDVAKAAGIYIDANGRMRSANGKFVASADKAKYGIEGVGNASEDAGGKVSKLGGVLKGLGTFAVAGAAVAGGAFVAFAKQAVTAAADAQAITAQFEQVFGDLGTTAQTEIDAMAKNFGMMPNRIKPSFTTMTSMFKGLGLDTEAAMEQAASATTLVADAAAFYDKSFEDANSALNSFIKGKIVAPRCRNVA